MRFGGAFDLLHVSDGSIDKLYLALWKGGVYEFKTDVTLAVGLQTKLVHTYEKLLLK